MLRAFWCASVPDDAEIVRHTDVLSKSFKVAFPFATSHQPISPEARLSQMVFEEIHSAADVTNVIRLAQPKHAEVFLASSPSNLRVD